jgi:hypothetical protein
MEHNRLCQVAAALKRQLQRHADAAVPYPAPFYRPRGREVNETFTSVETCSGARDDRETNFVPRGGYTGQIRRAPGFCTRSSL